MTLSYSVYKGDPSVGETDGLDYEGAEWENVSIILPGKNSEEVEITPEQIGVEKYNTILNDLKEKGSDMKWEEIKRGGVEAVRDKYENEYSGPQM